MNIEPEHVSSSSPHWQQTVELTMTPLFNKATNVGMRPYFARQMKVVTLIGISFIHSNLPMSTGLQ